MPITQKQMKDGRITRSVYFPLSVAYEIEERSQELGISWNKLINRLVVAALNDEKILNSALCGEQSVKLPPPEANFRSPVESHPKAVRVNQLESEP